ncbi:efflux transporter outer membrane subunit, partial [Gluconobacter cerinus]
MPRNLSLSSLVCLLLGGCTLIPHYDRPASPVTQTWPKGSAYRNTEISSADTIKSDAGWRDFYRDPVLQSLIAEALENNRDYRIAVQQIETASAQFDIENASLFPTLNGNASANIQKYAARTMRFPNTPVSQGSIYQRQYGVGFGISSYEIDLWGRIRSASRAAFDRYMSDVYARDSVNITLKASIATTVLNWVANNEGYRLTSDILSSWQKSYDLVLESRKSGSSNDLDVAEAEEALREAEKQLEIYDRQRAQAFNQLELLVGKPLTEVQKTALDEKKSLVDILAFPDVPAGLPSDLIGQRPDIISAEHTLLAANDDVGEARAEFFPKIQITAANGTASSGIKRLFRPGMGAWDIAPQITVPLFDEGRLTAQLKQAKANKRAEIARYEKTIQTGFREVADALAARETYARETVAQDSFASASQRQYQLAHARFEEGADSYLQTLVAQRTYLNAMTEG